MIKIGVLGSGFMGGTHVLCFENIPEELRISAVSDERENFAKQLAERCRAKYYLSSDELLDEFDGDVIDICLPTPLHKYYIVQALERGFHVFCEKPVALTVQEAREVLEASKKSDRKVMIGHCIRFWPEYLKLKEYIESKKLGELISIVFKRISSKRKRGLAWNEWIFDEKQSGSAAIDLQLHDVDFIRFILGEPDRIQSLLYSNRGQAEHIFSNFIYGKVVINMEASWAYPTGSLPFVMAFTALFAKGVVTYDSREKDTFRVFDEEAGQWSTPAIEYPQVRPVGTGGNVPAIYGYVNELRYFLDRIINDKTVEVGCVEESLKSLELTIRTAEIAHKTYRGEE
jgi:predicted dehydrogenase